MKKSILVLTLILGLTITKAQAQYKISAGAGLHVSNIKTQGFSTSLLNYKPITGWQGQVLFSYPVNSGLDIETGLTYATKGFMIQEGTGVNVLGLDIPIGIRADFNLNTVSLPLRLKYNMAKDQSFSPYLAGGIQLNHANSGIIKTRAESIFDFEITETKLNLSSSAYNRWGWSSHVAAGVQLDREESFITAEVYFNHDLNDFTNAASTIVDAGIRNYNVGLQLSYGMRF